MRQQRGFTIYDAMGLIGVAVIVGVMLPGLGGTHCHLGTALRMQSLNQLRGVHQGLVIHAQGNKGNYAGLNEYGNVVDATVEGRLGVLLAGSFFSPEYLISPFEHMESWGYIARWQSGTPFTSMNNSYAMLQLAGTGPSTAHPAAAWSGRLADWRDTNSRDAVVLSDRNTGSDAYANASSVYTYYSHSGWQGGIVWNDNHALYDTSHIMPSPTKYGGVTTSGDNIFEASGDSDAYLIHSGK